MSRQDAKSAKEEPPIANRKSQIANPAQDRLERLLLVLALCLLSAVLLRLSFPVPGWFPLAWVALVPWLVIVRTGSRRAAFWGSLVMGLAAAGLGLSWQFIVTIPGATGLTFYVGAYFVLFACLVRVATGRLRLPFVLAAPAVWVGCEYLRSWLFTGFPWLFLGHTQQPFNTLIQVSDIFGAYALSFMVMACNALLAEAVLARRAKPRPMRRLLAGGAFVVAMVAGALAYGQWRLAGMQRADGPWVGVVQGNIPQEVKNTITPQTICDIFVKHWKTTLELKEQAGGEPPDLIVWPESMVQWPLNWEDPPQKPEFVPALKAAAQKQGVSLPPEAGVDFRALLWALARQMGCPVLIGAHTMIGQDGTVPSPRSGVVKRVTQREVVIDDATFVLPSFHDPVTGSKAIVKPLVQKGQQVKEDDPLAEYVSVVFNSAYLFRPEGPSAGLERYDKMHLVPFGEYVPLKKYLWFLMPVVPYAKGFNAGDRAALFEVNGQRFGVLICFEDAFPRLVRRFIVRDDGGPGADYLINISNDGWFKDSHELEQHLALCSLRAVEFRTGIVRCTNTGISGILGSDGRLRSPVHDARGRRKEVQGFTIGRVMLRGELTFYARHGDVLAAACLAFAAIPFLLGTVLPFGRWLRRRLTSRAAA